MLQRLLPNWRSILPHISDILPPPPLFEPKCICQSKFVRPVSLYVRTSLLTFSLVCTYTYMLPEISVSLYVRTDFLKFQEMIFKFPKKFVHLDSKSTFPVGYSLLCFPIHQQVKRLTFSLVGERISSHFQCDGFHLVVKRLTFSLGGERIRL